MHIFPLLGSLSNCAWHENIYYPNLLVILHVQEKTIKALSLSLCVLSPCQLAVPFPLSCATGEKRRILKIRKRRV